MRGATVFHRGDRVVEDYDVGDREPRVGTVDSVRVFSRGTSRERTCVMVRWDERTTPQKSGFAPVDLAPESSR
jgi:hypothetical protein